ncbi:hypothetical protein T484DRAFT_1858290 [Baffinella frigidus]|nr:hypothetical protein T484DRAFT_1858290 [Cryptophyta sp. CCMP2293]
MAVECPTLDADHEYWINFVLKNATMAEKEASTFVNSLNGIGANACFQHSNSLIGTPITNVIQKNVLDLRGLDNYDDVKMRLETGLVFITEDGGVYGYAGEKSIQSVAQHWFIDFMFILFGLVEKYNEAVHCSSDCIQTKGCRTTSRCDTLEGRFPYIAGWAESMKTAEIVKTTMPDPSQLFPQFAETRAAFTEKMDYYSVMRRRPVSHLAIIANVGCSVISKGHNEYMEKWETLLVKMDQWETQQWCETID